MAPFTKGTHCVARNLRGFGSSTSLRVLVVRMVGPNDVMVVTADLEKREAGRQIIVAAANLETETTG
jgi:hypothetical protein